jgi:hypothetical protein
MDVNRTLGASDTRHAGLPEKVCCEAAAAAEWERLRKLRASPQAESERCGNSPGDACWSSCSDWPPLSP